MPSANDKCDNVGPQHTYVTNDTCCAGKPVALNHQNKGTTHLADDIPIPNEDAIMPIVWKDKTKTIIKGRSTREALNVQTTIVDLGL
jgi:hypothetical protein